MLSVILTVLVLNSSGQKVDTIRFTKEVTNMASCERIASNSKKQLDEIFKTQNFTVDVKCKEA